NTALYTQEQVFGTEFSPDNSKLYFTTISRLYQVDLSAGSILDIVASKTVIQDGVSTATYACQRGRDGKIYVATNSSFLDVIDDPDSLGQACNYQFHAMQLGNNNASVWGLPNFIVDYLDADEVRITGPDTICVASPFATFHAQKEDTSDWLNWYLIGQGQISSGIHDTTFVASFPNPGLDTVVCERFSACGVSWDTLYVRAVALPDIKLGSDTTICAGDSLTLSPGAGFLSYLWSDSSTGQSLTVGEPGIYTVEVYSGPQCVDRDTIEVDTMNPAPPQVFLGNDTTFCVGQVVVFDAGPGPGYTYLWQDGSTNQTITAWQTGTYHVAVTNACGMTVSDTIIVKINPIALLYLGPDTNLCANGQVILDAGPNYSFYQWQDGSTNQTYVVTVPDTYYVEVTNAFGCQDFDTVIVDACVGLADGSDGFSVAVYPNPTSGLFHVGLTGLIVGESLEIRLVNTLGQMVMTRRYAVPGSEMELEYDMANLSSGMYFLQVRTDSGVYSKRLDIRR
ncbi:MAG: T9SS type A sorting domain-containing protein, partial [Bacteroidota bacterium]